MKTSSIPLKLLTSPGLRVVFPVEAEYALTWRLKVRSGGGELKRIRRQRGWVSLYRFRDLVPNRVKARQGWHQQAATDCGDALPVPCIWPTKRNGPQAPRSGAVCSQLPGWGAMISRERRLNAFPENWFPKPKTPSCVSRHCLLYRCERDAEQVSARAYFFSSRRATSALVWAFVPRLFAASSA